MSAWAAAEVFRADPAAAGARQYVERFYPMGWADAALETDHWDTQAAFTYCRTPTADPAVLANMRAALARYVNTVFSENDLYRNGIPYTQYHWGSNRVRAKCGLSLIMAARLGTTGAYAAQDVEDHALDFLHYFHGQNPLRMVFLTNMASLGGEHSSFRFYHAWFGDSRDPFSRGTFIGKPQGVEEPDYPYFPGTDNLGARDGGTSRYGPPPGFLVGGPNKNYSGTSVPPANESYFGRFYRDWNDLDQEASSRTWEITENSVAAQGPYVALIACFSGRRAIDSGQHRLVYPPMKPRASVETTPFSHVERIDENGTWSSPRASLRMVHRQAGVPDAAITDGKGALAVCSNGRYQWKDELVRLSGFQPRRWSAYTGYRWISLWTDRSSVAMSTTCCCTVIQPRPKNTQCLSRVVRCRFSKALTRSASHSSSLTASGRETSCRRSYLASLPIYRLAAASTSTRCGSSKAQRLTDAGGTKEGVMMRRCYRYWAFGVGVVIAWLLVSLTLKPVLPRAAPRVPAAIDFTRGATSSRLLALTFDNDQVEPREQILDILRERGVHTTFFLTGRFIETHLDLVRRIVREGHEVGNHSYDHPELTMIGAKGQQVTRPTVTKKMFQDQLRITARLFTEVTGAQMSRFWRAPGGEQNPEIRRWAEELGYVHVGWTMDPRTGESLDSLDWVADEHSGRFFTPAQIRTRLLNFDDTRETGASGGIALFHLGSQRSPELAVDQELAAIIDGFRSRGYRLVPVSELYRQALDSGSAAGSPD